MFFLYAGLINRKLSVVREIGDRKITAAVPWLTKEMFNLLPFSADSGHFEEMYPCVTPLIKIGRPSVPALETKMKLATSFQRLVLVHALIKIEGVDWVVNKLNEMARSRILTDADLLELQGWIKSQYLRPE